MRTVTVECPLLCSCSDTNGSVSYDPKTRPPETCDSTTRDPETCDPKEAGVQEARGQEARIQEAGIQEARDQGVRSQVAKARSVWVHHSSFAQATSPTHSCYHRLCSP